MLGELKRLGRETMVYGVSTVVGRLLNFLLVPFYSHILSPEQNGAVTVVYSYIAFLNVAYQHGLDQAYLRHAASRDSGDARREAFSTSLWSLLASSLALSAGLIVFSGPLARAAGLPVGGGELLAMAAGILALDALATVPFAELRRAHKAWAFAAVRTTNIAVTLGLNILLAAGLQMGVRGVILANLLASAATLALLLPTMVPLLRPAFSSGLHRRMLGFALPLLPAGLASMTVQVIDRPLLRALTDESTVGVYGVVHKLGVFMLLVVGMFDQAWRPFFLEREGKEGSREMIARVLTYFLAGAVWTAMVLSLFMRELVALPLWGGRPLIHPAYWSGLGIVPVLLAGYVFNGLYVNFMAQPTLADRTELVTWAAGLGAVVSVAANLVLIPRMGMMGCAWAQLLAFASMALCLVVLGQRIYPIPYESGRLARIAFALTAVLAGLYAAAAATAGAGLPWFAARAAAAAAFPALLLCGDFLYEDEKAALRRRLGLG